jgi:hypothetical protein
VVSGINETFQQVGTAVGIAAVGALFQSQVAKAFTHSLVGSRIGTHARAAASEISAGSLTSAANAAGPLKQQVLITAKASFVLGFHDSMTFCGVVALIAAVIAVVMLRTKDLHSSALSLIPPDIEDELQHPESALV